MIKLPFLETTVSIFLVTLLPAIVGVALRAKYKTLTKRIQPALRYILPTLLFIVFAVKIFAGKESGGTGLTFEETVELAVPSLLLNISGMLLGFIFSSIFFLKLKNRITILIEVGLQNTALALLISGVLLDNHDMEKPAMVYAMLTFISTFLFAYLLKNIFFRWKMKQNLKADFNEKQ
jgi:BASS family bile acid:Na+ symporter